jgi:thioredoxin reductase (NADPH)
VVTTKATYLSKNIVLSTGFYDIPNTMGVPGEELPKVHHYYKDPHWFAYQKVAVIGAQNSAIDAALECYRKGAEVTLIIRQESLGERVKYWVKPDMENRIKEGSIKALFNTSVSRIDEGTITVKTGEDEQVLDNDFVLALTGYKPNYSLLNMLGVELSDNAAQCPHHHAETMETNVDGLYLAGVVCGGMDTHSWFIENSREHAVKIAAHIATKANQHQAVVLEG